ncbi:MAG: amidohydrolase [Nitrospirae bacterium]|nr:amidohydrolase [Nitrospirota bacterium]
MKVLTNAVVRTMDDSNRVASAVAYDGPRLVAVGPTQEVRRLAGPGAEVRDLAGRTVVPGFIDSHHHLSIALIYGGGVDCRPEAAPSIDVLLTRLAEAEKRLPPGAWLVGTGHDEWKIRERCHPTRDELDSVSARRPILLIHGTWHEVVANSAALAAAGIDERTPEPPSGVFSRDRRGRLNGHLAEMAGTLVEPLARADAIARDPHGLANRLGAYEDVLFSLGITRICDATVPPSIAELYAGARCEGKLRIPVVMMPIGERGLFAHPEDRLEGPPTGEGPEELRFGPMKLFFDGGTQCALCLSFSDLALSLGPVLRLVATRGLSSGLDLLRQVRPSLGRDLRIRSGVRYYDVRQGRDFVRRAVERGFATAIHAIGNEAVGWAIDVLGAARAAHVRQPPPRIEHGMILGRAEARRAADQGIMFVPQPYFLVQLGDALSHVPLPPRLKLFPLRTLVEEGVELAGSSDGPAGFDPIAALRAAVTRRAADGTPISPEEAIEPEDVLRMYTRGSARACGCWDVTGSLEAGKRADLVVLSDDPCRAGSTDWDCLRVVETILAGRTVFRRESVVDRTEVLRLLDCVAPRV